MALFSLGAPEDPVARRLAFRSSWKGTLADLLILALSGHIPAYGSRRALSLGADAPEMARGMFARLRDADALGADAIFSEAIAADGVGLAVMNRLERAAGFNIIEV